MENEAGINGLLITASNKSSVRHRQLRSVKRMLQIDFRIHLPVL